MPTKAASFKSLRQSKKHALRNQVAKLQIKDARRAVRKALDSKAVAKAEAALKGAIKLLDKAYSRGLMKLNAVSRHKCRLMAAVNAIKGAKK